MFFRLVDIAKVIIKKMISIGLAKEETRDLTLHMTIMNSKYVVSSKLKSDF